VNPFYGITITEWALMLLVIAASLAGTHFAAWRASVKGSICSAVLLVGISTVVALCGERHAVASPTGHYLTLLSFGLGLGLGAMFPCCGAARFGVVQGVALATVLIHCLLDGHVIREVHSGWLVVLLLAHKFQDGADGRLTSSERPVVQRLTRLAVVAATPLGYFFLPEDAVHPLLHAALFAAVVGLNIGSAWYLIQHAVRLTRATKVAC
jgi:hypothetical protein